MEELEASPVASSKRQVYSANCGSEVVKNVKVGNPTRDKPIGVFQVTTTPLTNESIAEFFKPKSSVPRTMEKRLAAARASLS